jgi:hypothetical protein
MGLDNVLALSVFGGHGGGDGGAVHFGEHGRQFVDRVEIGNVLPSVKIRAREPKVEPRVIVKRGRHARRSIDGVPTMDELVAARGNPFAQQALGWKDERDACRILFANGHGADFVRQMNDTTKGIQLGPIIMGPPRHQLLLFDP